MSILFLSLTFSATIFLLIVSSVMSKLDKINKIKKDLDVSIPASKLSALLAELDNDNKAGAS